jgi:DNA-binding MarR family transcriptional regulator
MKIGNSTQECKQETLIVDDFLPYLLGHASNLISRQIDEIAAAEKMSRNECKVLLTLIDHEGVSLNELAGLMIIKQPTLSRIVETMVDAGWVNRAAVAKDRRAVDIRLTRSGIKKAQPLLSHARKMDDLLKKDLGGVASKKLKKLLLQLIETHNISDSN